MADREIIQSRFVNYDKVIADQPHLGPEAHSFILDAVTAQHGEQGAEFLVGINEAAIRRSALPTLDLIQPGSERDITIAIDTRRGTVKKVLGGFVAGAVLAAGGVLGYQAYTGFSGFKIPPLIGGQKSTQLENSSLDSFIKTDELCFAEVAGKSGANAKFQGQLLGADIPGAWMSESLNEELRERVCIDTKKTSLVWSADNKNVKVTVAPDGILTDTNVQNIIGGQSDRGATMAASEALSIFWSVVSDDGLPATIDGARTQLRNLAQLQTAENFVEKCGPIAWKQFAGQRSTDGLKQIIMKFNPAIQKVDVVLPTPPAFRSATAYPALQTLHTKDLQHNNVSFSFEAGSASTCTVPDKVPVTDKANHVLGS